jgi:hypothetical protein
VPIARGDCTGYKTPRPLCVFSSPTTHATLQRLDGNPRQMRQGTVAVTVAHRCAAAVSRRSLWKTLLNLHTVFLLSKD